MKPADIEVGRTYYNRSGARRARRLVLSIAFDIYSDAWGVRYKQIAGPNAGREGHAWLYNFARWAGGEAR